MCAKGYQALSLLTFCHRRVVGEPGNKARAWMILLADVIILFSTQLSRDTVMKLVVLFAHVLSTSDVSHLIFCSHIQESGDKGSV